MPRCQARWVVGWEEESPKTPAIIAGETTRVQRSRPSGEPDGRRGDDHADARVDQVVRCARLIRLVHGEGGGPPAGSAAAQAAHWSPARDTVSGLLGLGRPASDARSAPR